MKPIFYTERHTGTPPIAIQLNKAEIDYDVVPIDPYVKGKEREKEISKLVTKIRKSGFIGKFEQLATLPVLEYNGRMYQKNMIPEIIEKIIENKPTPVEPQHQPLNNLADIDEDAATHILELALMQLPEKALQLATAPMSPGEQFAFYLGTRWGRHAAAEIVADEVQGMKLYHTLIRKIDPWTKL